MPVINGFFSNAKYPKNEITGQSKWWYKLEPWYSIKGKIAGFNGTSIKNETVKVKVRKVVLANLK
ncbi:MAG: hypothetical protein IJV99_03680 [Clostridia bacterium]|nr:hypothetical protein [Clostridia bacterium]